MFTVKLVFFIVFCLLIVKFQFIEYLRTQKIREIYRKYQDIEIKGKSRNTTKEIN